jgi:hypothetical protein
MKKPFDFECEINALPRSEQLKLAGLLDGVRGLIDDNFKPDSRHYARMNAIWKESSMELRRLFVDYISSRLEIVNLEVSE